MLKKLDLYAYFSQTWVHLESTLMELNMFFFIKDDKLLEQHNEIWKTVN